VIRSDERQVNHNRPHRYLLARRIERDSGVHATLRRYAVDEQRAHVHAVEAAETGVEGERVAGAAGAEACAGGADEQVAVVGASPDDGRRLARLGLIAEVDALTGRGVGVGAGGGKGCVGRAALGVPTVVFREGSELGAGERRFAVELDDRGGSARLVGGLIEEGATLAARRKASAAASTGRRAGVGLT